MAWSGSAAELQRWEGKAGQDYQAGQSISPTPPGPRGDGELALAPQKDGSPGCLDQEALAAPAGAAGYGGARQQVGPHRLGDHDDGRALPLGCSDSSRIAAGGRTSFAGDGGDSWPVRSEVMNSRRTVDQGIPNPDRRLERVELMRNLGRGYHHGQRAAASHQQAGHMTAIAKEQSRQKALAKGPSTYGRDCGAGRALRRRFPRNPRGEIA